MAGKESLQQKTMTGFLWSFFERIGAQLVSFIVSIVLARLLLPEEYGLVSLVMVLIAILNVFVSEGFPRALIQKKESDDIDFSSVFYFNIVFSVILYILVYLLAPCLEVFFQYDTLSIVIRVMSIKVIIASITSVQKAYVSKHMQFRKFFWSTLGGTLISAVVGVVLAYQGYGVWALVAQYLTNSVIDTLVLTITIKWSPKLKFSFARLKGLVSYGGKVLVAGLIATIYQEMRSLIIGKKYSSSDLAYYNKGKQFPYLIVDNITSAVSTVLLPAIALKQDDSNTVKFMLRRAVKTSSYLIMPMMIGLAVVAEPLILLLLTEKWLPCVPFVQILCFNAALMPIQSSNLQAIYAVGRSDIAMRLEIMKKSFGIIMVLVFCQISVIAVAYAGMITAIFCSIVNSYPNKKLFGYGYFEQIRDIVPYIFLSGAMGGIVWLISLFSLPAIFQLCLQVLVGIAVYIVLSLLFKVESFHYIVGFVKKIFSKKM